MIPAKKDFIAGNATPWLAEIVITNPDGSAYDLSGYASFLMHVKASAFDPEPQLVPTMTLVAGGSHNVLRIAHDIDADLASLWGVYAYDVVGLDGDGKPVDKILYGAIDVNQGVTVAGA